MTRRKRPGALLELSDVVFTGASAEEVETGLVGFVSFVIGDVLVVDGVTVRRTRKGRVALTFPEREDGAGRRHPLLRPKNDRARRILEDLVLARIGLDELAP